MQKVWQYRKAVIAVFVVLTVLLAFGASLGMSEDQKEASTDPPGRVFDLQKKADKVFSSEEHPVAFSVFRGDDKNVLTKDVLGELKQKSDKLRSSDIGKEYFLAFDHHILGNSGYLGFFTIADAVDDKLRQHGLTYQSATNKQVRQVAFDILRKNTAEARFLRSRMSTLSSETSVPAFFFIVHTDNEKLGGGVFRRNVGGDSVTIEKERFNREIQDMLAGENYTALGMGIDVNLESQEEGFSTPILLRNIGLLVALAALAGLLMRSLRIGIFAFAGLLALLVWIMGFPGITFGLVKPSLTTMVILPMAFMALGVDSYLYVVRRYEQEKALFTPAGALRRSFAGIGTVLVLAAVTDAVAFGANGISDVEAIRSFAFTGMFSAFAAFFVMGVVMPVFLALRDKKKPRKVQQLSPFSIAPLLRSVHKFRFVVVLFLVGVTVVSAFGISRVERGFDPNDFLMQNSDFVRSLDMRQKHWGSVRGEEAFVYIEGNLDDAEVNKAVQSALKRVKNNPFLAHNKQGELVLPQGPMRRQNLASDNQAIKLSFEVMRTEEVSNVTTARESLENNLSVLKGVASDYGVTGPPFTREASLNAVTDEPIKTASLAVAAIFAILWISLRSLSFSIKTLVPMALVVVWTYGFMGWFAFDLNFITATIAAVGLGIGVDYALHLTHSFRRAYEHGHKGDTMLEVVGEGTGLASFAAALSSIAGFGVLATAPMPLFATYGILGMVIIAFSFFASILFVPLFSYRK